jgi:peptidoglycan hydrolase-like protein with peptidoglycan-binding domain
MGEEQQGLDQAKRFDLLTNPFSILDVDPTASLEQVAKAFDAAATGHALESELIAARWALTDSRQRTLAELSFLLDTPAHEVKPLLAALKADTSLDDLVRLADRLAPLSKANLLVHAGSRRPANANLLCALVDAHACIEPRTVFAKLEATRKSARIGLASFDSVRDGLHELLLLHLEAVLSAYPTARASAKPVEECTKRVLASADPDRIDALERLVRAFGSRVAPALLQIEQRIKSTTEILRGQPDELGLTYSLASELRKWIGLARPLVELDAHKGRDEERARQLFVEVRNLSIDLADQHDRFDVALSICNAAAEVFQLLPRATEQLNADRAALEERLAELPVFPLRKWIEERSGNTVVLARHLEVSGFGRTSAREAKELWNLFVLAAETTQHSKAADRPWMIVHGLATDLNKDEQSPLAAKAILDGLLAYAQQIAPSPKLLELMRDDLRAVERSIRERRPAEDPKADRASPALEGIYQLLMDPKSPENSQPVAKPKGMLKQRWTTWLEGRRNMRYLQWGAYGLVGVGALILSGGILLKSFRPPDAGYRNAPGQQTADYLSPQPQADDPSPNPLSQEAELLIEKPPAGTGKMLSQASIRYCLYQKERMKVIDAELRSADERSAFDTITTDYNSRCGNFRYRDSDLRVVTDEVSRKSEVLAAEALSIVAGWRGGSTLQPSLAAFPATTPGTLSPTPSDPSANLDPASAGIDLLQLETAIKTQRRLGQLGYFRGPSNGAWGPQSRSALRSFKVANGLSNDDALDQTTAARLYSRSAARNTSFANMAAAVTVATESSYPPPPGATLNPLNRSDAIKIHARLRELGFYRAAGYMLWSAASRDALKEFKASSELAANDEWDAATETRLMSATPALMSATPARPARDIPAGFGTAVTGIWSIDARACPGGAGGSDALPIKITQNRAETEGARCEFENVSGLGTIWKTLGTCTVNGQTRKANISLVRTGNVLVWSSENGTTKYQRCAG